MNRKLQFVNLFGVMILVGLCVFQWRQNRALNLGLNDLEKTRQAQEQKLGEQDKVMRGLADDLARFKEQFTSAKGELTETREKLGVAERTLAQVSTERDQLQINLTNWMNAVTERDAKLKEANERITEVVGRLNESVAKFNQLVTNHNDVVVRYNELAKKIPAEAAK
jgi:chromosome segregation ATPase